MLRYRIFSLIFPFLALINSDLIAKPLVYDCFLFLNEFEVLDIRLHEMNDVVDRFVIVESVETFRGNPKPLNFAENMARFEPFEHKIIYVVLYDRFKTVSPWDRETHQRNQILLGLAECTDEDIIMISDVDEIVKAEGVSQIYSAICNQPNSHVGVSQKLHFNLLNSIPSGIWNGTVATSYGELKRSSPQSLRDIRSEVRPVAEGWHFTWQGGIAKGMYKLGAYSHAESDNPEVREAITSQKNNCPVTEIDDSFPLYVRENQDYFERIGYILRPPQ